MSVVEPNLVTNSKARGTIIIVSVIPNFRLYDGSDLKTYLLMRWLRPDAVAVLSGPPEFTCWIFFAPVESLSLLYILVIS